MFLAVLIKERKTKILVVLRSAFLVKGIAFAKGMFGLEKKLKEKKTYICLNDINT